MHNAEKNHNYAYVEREKLRNGNTYTCSKTSCPVSPVATNNSTIGSSFEALVVGAARHGTATAQRDGPVVQSRTNHYGHAGGVMSPFSCNIKPEET
jgi:hypothetical protein